MIAIIFPHGWPHKSPILLELIKQIKKKKLKYILYIPNKARKNWNSNKVKYFDNNFNIMTRFFIKLLSSFSVFDRFLTQNIAKNILNTNLKIENSDILICFDFFGYNFLSKNYSFKKKYIFSTELFLYFKNIYNLLNDQNIKLVIQSKIRANFLGFRSSKNVVMVDNLLIDENYKVLGKNFNKNYREGLLYSGSICKELGSEILNKLACNDNRTYKFTIHGMIELNSDKKKKLFVLKNFLSEFEIRKLMFKNKVGLVIYDFKNITRVQNFNFKTGPSGKLLKYILHGLPVIGVKCNGLQDIEKYEAGILLNKLTVDEINMAYNKIISNYAFYRKGVNNFILNIIKKKRLIKYKDFFI